MRRSTRLLFVSALMSAAAAFFVLYALNHPELSFDLPLRLVLVLCAVYVLVAEALFIAFIILRIRRK